jgi:hypothetical protein
MRYYDETMTDFGDWTAVRTALEPGAQVFESRAGLELFRESRTLYVLEPAGTMASTPSPGPAPARLPAGGRTPDGVVAVDRC